MSSGHPLLSGDGGRVRVRVLGYGSGVRGRKVKSLPCQTLSGPLPQSGSPAREARGAAVKMGRGCENGPQRQAMKSRDCALASDLVRACAHRRAFT